LRRRWCSCGCGDGSENFGDGGEVDFAAAVVDAALRKSEVAAAGARFRVEFVERDSFLFRRELGKIDAGEFAGTVGMFKKNLAGVLESFHFYIADGQAEERTDFGFVENRIAQAFVLLYDAALGIEHEGSGKSRNSAVLEANVVSGDGNGIVDAEFFHEFLDGARIVVVHDEAENLQAVFVFVLELDEVRDFGAAGSAPGSPEVQKDDFAFEAGEGEGLAVEAGQFEVGSGIRVASEADGGLLGFLGDSADGQQDSQRKEQSASGPNYRKVSSPVHLGPCPSSGRRLPVFLPASQF
jgi:hypothetical protein